MLSCKFVSELEGGRCVKQREPTTGIMIVAVNGAVLTEHAYCCLMTYMGYSTRFSDATYDKMHTDYLELVKAGVFTALGPEEKYLPWVHLDLDPFKMSVPEMFLDFASAQVVS